MKNYKVNIEVLSPLHLGAGHADVVTDAEAVRDKYGLPFFPGKRLKGLLYESALELAEMASMAGLSGDKNWFSVDDVNRLFAQQVNKDGRKIDERDMDVKESGIRVDNFYLPNYEELCAGWEYLQDKYSGLFTALDVWDSYSELRYQTAIDKESKTASEGTLRNLRAVESGTVFGGRILLIDDSNVNKNILEKALMNLRYAGAKRNRGFGRIKCTIGK